MAEKKGRLLLLLLLSCQQASKHKTIENIGWEGKLGKMCKKLTANKIIPLRSAFIPKTGGVDTKVEKYPRKNTHIF